MAGGGPPRSLAVRSVTDETASPPMGAGQAPTTGPPANNRTMPPRVPRKLATQKLATGPGRAVGPATRTGRTPQPTGIPRIRLVSRRSRTPRKARKARKAPTAPTARSSPVSPARRGDPNEATDPAGATVPASTTGPAGVTVPARVTTELVRGRDPVGTASIKDGPTTLAPHGGRTAPIRAVQVTRQVSRRRRSVVAAAAAVAHSRPFANPPCPRCGCLLRYQPRYCLRFQACRSSLRSKRPSDLPLARRPFRSLRSRCRSS
jgi:hypothetical protein